MSDITSEQQEQMEQLEREQLVADWLRLTPGFFDRHPDVLVDANMKNPHGQNAISLQERQLGVLRKQNQELNQKLSEMLHFGGQNDKTQGLMIAWLKRLLEAKSEEQVTQAITTGLVEVFGVEQVVISGDTAEKNYCGPLSGAPSAVQEKFDATIASVVAHEMPSLNKQILIGSASLNKFTPDMGRFYIDQIGELAEAALLRSVGVGD